MKSSKFPLLFKCVKESLKELEKEIEDTKK